jgi:tRNA pseudouridine38-40 synthase
MRNFYVIYLQYLGYRYSGWQKQPGRKTIEGMLTKTLRFVLPGRSFKILGAGRTDARVSALKAAFELFLEGEPLKAGEEFIRELNRNLPPDIRVLKLEVVEKDFNIIKHCNEKEYWYFFSFGEKLHPFAAPFMAGIHSQLNIGLMMEMASLYAGTHDFRAYTAKKKSDNRDFNRTLDSCVIEKNALLAASFFPHTSYVLRISGAGFMRYQVRMVMGALMLLGKGEILPTDIEESLRPGNTFILNYIAPGSGLVLGRLNFE